MDFVIILQTSVIDIHAEGAVCVSGATFLWVDAQTSMSFPQRGTMIAQVYRDDIFDVFVRSNAGAIGDCCLL